MGDGDTYSYQNNWHNFYSCVYEQYIPGCAFYVIN
jgi:hypothetical protein